MENRSFQVSGEELVRPETSETSNDWDSTQVAWPWLKKAKTLWERILETVSSN